VMGPIDGGVFRTPCRSELGSLSFVARDVSGRPFGFFFPEIADGPFDSARRTDMAHGKARVVLQFNGLDHAQHLRDSLLTQSPVRCNSTAGFRRGRRRSPQGLRLLVSQMDDGAADSCCPSSLCSFSVMKLE
jgi:hypothetical protein